MLLTAEDYEQLKCSICHRALSKFPIYAAEGKDDQSLSVCGRCEVPSDDQKYLRNTIFETISKNVQFPCINRQNGCQEYLLPENIEQHELLCQYQLIKCKICEWEGQSFTALDHYQSKHADLILKNYKFNINLKEDSKSSNILLNNVVVFLFECNFDKDMKRVQCILDPLFSTRIVKKYYAQIKLIVDDTTMLKKFPGIDLDENERKSIEINIGNLLNDGCTEATGIINVTHNIKEVRFREQVGESLFESEYNTDDNMVLNTNLQASNNQLLNLIYEPCQYGCTYISMTLSDIKQHYKECLNKPYKCLLNCGELISRNTFKSHICNKHMWETVSSSVSINTFSITIELFTNKKYSKLLTYNGSYFILIIQHIEPHLLLWRVEGLDLLEKKFRFKISMSKNGNELSLQTYCAELTCNENYNITDTSCIWLHLDHVKHFMNTNKLSFDVTIT